MANQQRGTGTGNGRRGLVTNRRSPHGGQRLWRRLSRFGVRTSLLVVLLPLLTLPWLGLRFVEQMAELARDERLLNQAAAARSFSAALHERAELFRDLPQSPPPAGAQPAPVALLASASADGKTDEWVDVSRLILPVTLSPGAPADTLRVRMALARSQELPGRLFVLVEADDERLVRPGDEAAATTPDENVSSEQPGDQLWVETGASAQTLKSMPVLLRSRPGGWFAELQLPDAPSLLRVRVSDVDYLGSRRVEASADSGLLAPADPTVNMARPARGELWQETVKSLQRAAGRVSVYDRKGTVLAAKGSFNDAALVPNSWHSQLARWLLNAATRLQPGALDDPLDDDSAARAHLSPMARALTGAATQQSRRIADVAGMPTWLLTSAEPVWFDDEIAAVLVLEESTAARLMFGQQALEQLALLSALAIASTALALLAVASLLVGRIVRLRHDAEAAIDSRGRVVASIAAARLHDELGGLRASYRQVLSRLHAHQDYLVKLRARLMHELRTPIMVVRSSLENLIAENDPAQRTVYIERVQSGAARLERMVASMGEASSLETMLDGSETEPVDLGALMLSCVEGYRSVFDQRQFSFQLPKVAARVQAVPEAIVQALDKLVSNANDFAVAGSAIVVSLTRGTQPAASWQIAVQNRGSALPLGMEQTIFDQMVSIRADRADQQSHLGLGLYLVRLIAEFHGGDVWAKNTDSGVEVGFSILAE